MALTKISEKEVKNIIIGLTKAATRDIKCLTAAAYQFIHVASGFMAHYNILGFVDYYGTATNLGDYILQYRTMNQWENFYKDELDYEYMMQQKQIYNAVCRAIEEFRSSDLFRNFEEKEYEIAIKFKSKAKDSASAYAIAMQHQFVDIPGSKIEINEVKK